MDDEEEKERPRIVRRSPTSRRLKLCINCLSPLEHGRGIGGWLVPQDYSCSKCGYMGYVYVEENSPE